MEDLLQKIRAIHVTNEEIIARVEDLSEVHLYEYYFKPKLSDDEDYALEEIRRTVKVQCLIQEFEFKGDLRTDVWDVFNDKPNWKCSTWADLKRLNKELHAIVDKFELLDKNNAKAKNELAKYLHNFEVIQTGLGQLEAKTLSETSRLQELEQRIVEINAMIAELKKAGVKAKADFTGGSFLNNAQIKQLTDWYGPGWSLLYKASRDGWQGSDFHAKCDNKGETVTVVKAGNNIFGGYLGVPWQGHGSYIQCTKASLFTLVNQHGIAPTKFNVTNTGYAGYGNPGYGPTFGGGHDLHIASGANTNTKSYSSFTHSYQDTTGKGNALFAGGNSFQVTDVEVFGKQ
eukprot:TRINITY_DN8163_c0_g1_i1.p1 TRINITY_DN8163_c0_g1~~TRINITY_DN8163_c0_g1_i1.p1  ORF type:complete len:372 (-),score=90.92 TRINITY_DN8163_c0_g1_i1:7-1038(-)